MGYIDLDNVKMKIYMLFFSINFGEIKRLKKIPNAPGRLIRNNMDGRIQSTADCRNRRGRVHLRRVPGCKDEGAGVINGKSFHMIRMEPIDFDLASREWRRNKMPIRAVWVSWQF
uniref:Uncharacterized protein n=1 Tax=Pithovirus LCPAC304 TaxID=2506594 RepID=A0A481Z836_9VIRU|nr:MAG: hypothetical protein LCPAC304_01140 [Pithovirus LCPAC304]